MIAVIDYGLGNLRSVSKALETVGAEVEVTSDSRLIEEARGVVLPGVGAFSVGMDNLRKLDLISVLSGAISAGKPFLGICLGLQLLFTRSEEHGISEGMNIISGDVKKFSSASKIPHMGWNTINIKSTRAPERQALEEKIKLFEGIPDNSYFYFVHSYYVEPEDEETVIAATSYGTDFVSAINKDNIWGIQFHPEKSTEMGLRVLGNFVKLSNKKSQ